VNPRYPLNTPPDPELLDQFTADVVRVLQNRAIPLPAPAPSDVEELRQHLGEFLWGRV